MGTKYSSYIEHLYLEDRMHDFMYEREMPQKSGFFLLSDAEIGFMAGKDNFFTVDFSVFSETGLNYPEYSKINPYVVISANYRLSNHFSLNFSMTGHYAGENYLNFESLYCDGHLNINLFYDHSDYLALYFEVKGGYYHSFYEKVEYLNGTTALFEAGTYIYPNGDLNYIKVMAGSGYFNFREEEYIVEDVGSILIGNRYFKPYFQVESEWLFGKVALGVNFQYSYLHLFEKDYTIEFDSLRYSDGKWEKARREHQVISGITAEYLFSESLKLSLSYQGKRNFSNIGNETVDYTDYNYFQHMAGLSFAYGF